MIEQLTKWQTWVLATVIGPIFWIVFIGILTFTVKELKAIRKWYWGLPIYQYPAMLLIILGARHILKPYGEWKKFDGRWWLTIKTQGFISEEGEVR